MKAYLAHFEGEDWVMLVHGETRGKAKYNFLRWNPGDSDASYYPEIRMNRLPGQDDKPFTFENADKAGFNYFEEDGETVDTFFINDCRCIICKEATL
jgi:hypothetical protein